MPPRDRMLRRMKNRAAGPVPAGEPVIPDGPIPDGPVATTEDAQEFKQQVQALGYKVKFGQAAAVTKPGPKLVAMTANRKV